MKFILNVLTLNYTYLNQYIARANSYYSYVLECYRLRSRIAIELIQINTILDKFSYIHNYMSIINNPKYFLFICFGNLNYFVRLFSKIYRKVHTREKKSRKKLGTPTYLYILLSCSVRYHTE